MSNLPYLSIIRPSYNQGEFLGKTMLRVFARAYSARAHKTQLDETLYWFSW